MFIFIITLLVFRSIESTLDNLPSLKEARINFNYPYSSQYHQLGLLVTPSLELKLYLIPKITPSN